VGAGQVGASAALYAAQKQLGDVVLVDIMEGVPQGKALDMSQTLPFFGTECRITGSNTYEATANSDVVIVTAGLPRKPGMSREDLLMTNAKIVRGVMEEVVKRSPQSIVITVTNPLDVMTYLVYKISRFDKRRVIGMAGVPDSASSSPRRLACPSRTFAPWSWAATGIPWCPSPNIAR
jgi:malate dehydrogenase